MMIAALGRGRSLHTVTYRPDLEGRWRAICGRARSDTVHPEDRDGPSSLPPCPRCIAELRLLTSTMESLR